MGWKNIKEGYAIGHQVHVTDEGICIGSPYIHNIIVIAPDGTLKKRYERRSNGDLYRYQNDIEADPERCRRLIETPDTFAVSLPVFTYDGAEIIEEQCEAHGWPNVTHRGHLMYSNTFFAEKERAVVCAKRNALAEISLESRGIEELRHRLESFEARLAVTRANLAKLDADFPDIAPEQ
jgi:hypothetical protein